MSSSARRALRILEILGAAERPLGVTEIGRRLGLPGGTVFRGLDALERAGYVERYLASSRYVLGAGAARLRQSLFARFHLREICPPYLRQLAFASGETASLNVPVGWYVVRIAAAPGTSEVTSSPPLGEFRTLGQGSAGMALLADTPGGAERYFAWAGDNELHPPALAPLAAELAAIRARGFAIEATEFAAGRAALALPIRGPDRAVAAIAIEGPVLDLARPFDHPDLPRWIEIAHSIEHVVRAQPALFENSFAHLDADEIVLKGGA
jgi:IclR family transcriptional regulator, acetate operon repressor